MDQVRAFFRVMWQQRFWVLSVVGILIAAICWMMATGHIQAEFAANKTTISGKFSDMDAIANAPVHGNDSVNAKNEQETAKIKSQVLDLWKQLYDKQRETVLYWPKNALGEEFVDTVEKLKFREEITDPDLRGVYWNYIKKRFDDLVKIVDAKKMKEGEMGMGFAGGDMSAAFETQEMGPRGLPGMEGQLGMPVEEDFIVQWLDQGNLRAKLDFPRLPSSLQIWVTQEDLWVYETLLHAIANTNKEKKATRIDNAAIRGIVQLDVGQAAAMATREPGNIILPEGAMAGGDPNAMGPEGMPMGGEGGMPMGPEGMPMGGEGMTEGADPGAMLLVNRYVDKDGAPIASDAEGFGTEFRRLPIRMRLYMDQRWIPKVLIECANAALPVEVQRVRINPEQSGAGFDATIAGSGGGGGMPMPGGEMGGRGMGMGMGMGMRGGMEGGGGMGMSMPAATGPSAGDMAQVEILGVVYIYNQPDDAALSVPGGEGAAPAADASVAAAQ